MNKRAVSPLVATGLLIVFAIVIGVIVMNLSKSYVEQIADEEEVIEETEVGGCNPLQILQISYADGEISEQEYNQRKTTLTT